MARVRLKAEVPSYEGVRNNYAASNHGLRALVTGATIAMMEPETIIDPAVGDGSILDSAFRMRPFKLATMNDISAAQTEALTQSVTFPWDVIETADALDFMQRHPEPMGQPIGVVVPRYDMAVLTEILEHVDDPDRLLLQARLISKNLVASSPIGDPESGTNSEHVWAFGEDDYEAMLRAAGWEPLAKQVQTFPGYPYNSQIWLCR